MQPCAISVPKKVWLYFHAPSEEFTAETFGLGFVIDNWPWYENAESIKILYGRHRNRQHCTFAYIPSAGTKAEASITQFMTTLQRYKSNSSSHFIFNDWLKPRRVLFLAVNMVLEVNRMCRFVIISIQCVNIYSNCIWYNYIWMHHWIYN